MNDVVTIVAPVSYKPWNVPGFARITTASAPETDELAIPVAELHPSALDALAEHWLGNLYASVNRDSPFKLIDA